MQAPAATWAKLENIMPKEASHKGPYIVWFHSHEASRVGKSRERESRLVVGRSWEDGGLG